MTRPIYEPSTQRQIRGQGFTADQLLRRPAPTGSGSIPMLRAISDSDWRSTPVVVADDTPVDLTFKYWQISDASIFEAVVAGMIDDELYVWRGLIPGLYAFKCAFEMDGNPGVTADVYVKLFTDMVGGAFTGGMYPFYDQLIGQAPLADNNSMFVSNTYSIPPFDPEGQAIDPTDPPTGWEGYLQFYAETSDASSLNLEYARLEVFYLGPLDWETVTQS